MTARVLVVMRHAKSDWSGDVPDLERPIGRRGRRQAAEAGAWLAEHLPDLELVVTSPAERARSTASVVASYVDRPVRGDERLYTWDAAGVLASVRDIDDAVTTAVVVGHNPALEEFVVTLTGVDAEMVTSALAVLRFDGDWRDLGPGGALLAANGRPPGALAG